MGSRLLCLVLSDSYNLQVVLPSHEMFSTTNASSVLSSPRGTAIAWPEAINDDEIFHDPLIVTLFHECGQLCGRSPPSEEDAMNNLMKFHI